MMNIELTNPSAFHPLRIYQQDRARNTFDKAPPAAAMPKRETRAELQKRGSVITPVPTKIMTKQGAVTRDVPTPLWQAQGAESIEEWCTRLLEQMADDARRIGNISVPAIQRVVDTWGEPKPFESIPPHGKRLLPLAEDKRFVIECDEDVALQLSNIHNTRTIRLRTRDSKTGETTTVAHIPPAREYPQAAIVNANGKTAAVIELTPS
jgi:hypothetical protein